MTDHYKSRASTHSDDCWSWGPTHYECAVREIKALRAEVVKLRNIRADAVHAAALANIRAELLAAALEEAICKRAAMTDRGFQGADMTIDEIIELAKQAGFTANDEQEVFLRVFREEIERFATLIRNEVLEEAAGVCEESGHECAAAIRAMKEQA